MAYEHNSAHEQTMRRQVHVGIIPADTRTVKKAGKKAADLSKLPKEIVAHSSPEDAVVKALGME